MKRDQRLIQSENAIIEAGIKTFLTNPTAGMSDIATASGVGRTTLYRHFESKESLLLAIALHCFEEIDEALKPLFDMSGREAIEATFALLIPIADRYRFLNSMWPEASDDPRVTKKLKQSFSDMEWLMDQAKKAGEIDKALPSVWLTTFFEMTLYAAWSLLESGDINADEAAQFATRSFFLGCAKVK